MAKRELRNVADEMTAREEEGARVGAVLRLSLHVEAVVRRAECLARLRDRSGDRGHVLDARVSGDHRWLAMPDHDRHLQRARRSLVIPLASGQLVRSVSAAFLEV
jgi:hypothetical protein